MNVHIFDLMVAALRREFGCGDTAAAGCLRVAGTEVSLSRETDTRGEHLWICVDFGAVPDAQADAVYRAMLESNLRAGSPEAGLLALQPNGRVVLLVRHPLTAALRVDALAPVLAQYAAIAKHWVDTQCRREQLGA